MSECPLDLIEDSEYFRAFMAKAAAARIPLSGSMELTRRCNLRCVHCYAGPAPAQRARGEMASDQACRIIDQIADAGCLFFLITGGEPLLRPDFPLIYRHCRKRGLLVTVFTNASLVDAQIADLFAEYPPHCVEISVYGATAATHDGITGLPHSHRRTMRGIEQLAARAVKLQLKTVLMTRNRRELTAMRALAASVGAKFRMDAGIFPRFNRDPAPLRLRVPAAEAVEREFADPHRAEDWIRFFRRTQALPATDRLYPCGAGRRSFHVDDHGRMQPCLMVPQPSFDLKTGPFADGWRRAIPAIQERTARPDSTCSQCAKRTLCGFCPATFALESGDEALRSDYLCAIGHERYRRIRDHLAAPPPGADG